MRPNDYTRADVIQLARIIDPKAWDPIPVGQDTHSHEDYRRCDNSVTLAARILVANYRDCTL